jgi:hypothetical protein
MVRLGEGKHMRFARSGSLLLVASGVLAVAAIALAFAGEAVGLGSSGPGGILVIAILTLLGSGSAFLALADSSPVLRSRGVRGSLGIFGVGALMEAAFAIGSATRSTEALESLPLVILMLGGGAVMLLGLVALAITVPSARRRLRTSRAHAPERAR